MKLQVFSALLFVAIPEIFAASHGVVMHQKYHSNSKSKSKSKPPKKIVKDESKSDDLSVATSPNSDHWEYIDPPLKEEIIGSDIEGADQSKPIPTSSQYSWPILSFFGRVFSTQPTPLQKLQATGVKASELVSTLKCKPEDLLTMNHESLSRFDHSRSISRIEVLSQLTEIGDRALFELFFTENLALILEEIKTDDDFKVVVSSCIKIDSINSLTNLSSSRSIPLSGPQAIIDSSINGSTGILQFLIDQKDTSTAFEWAWTIENTMNDFGDDAFSAALFLGAVEAITRDNLNVLSIILKSSVNVVARNHCKLLKLSAEKSNLDCFKEVYNFSVPSFKKIGNSIMNDVLRNAINSNKIEIVIFVLGLQYNYTGNSDNNLVSAISNKNKEIVDAIMKHKPDKKTDMKLLFQAANSGNEDIFLILLQYANDEIVCRTLLNFIRLDEKYRSFISLIIAHKTLSTGTLSQCLAEFVMVGSEEFIRMLLAKSECVASAIKPGFIKALETDNLVFINPFLEKFSKLDELVSIRGNNLDRLIESLFEAKRWNSLNVIVQFFDQPSFPKFLFMAMVMETDQVDLASKACNLGGVFQMNKLSDVNDERMRELVFSTDKVLKTKTRK